MMAHKQLLHELLKEDQEPFHLKSYIADKRSSQLNNSPPAASLQVKKRSPVAGETCLKRSNLSRNACLFSFNNSSDVGKSPILDFRSRAISPCKSPGGAAFLHVPSKTAALLVQAAMRIQKRQQSKPISQIKNFGLSLFGSFLKILRHRSKHKVLGNYERKEKGELQADIRLSCPCSSNGEFALPEVRLYSSPVASIRISLHKNPSSSCSRSPECCSPAASPVCHVKQKETYATGDYPEYVHGGEGDKDQCSPVSVLDPFFEDNGHGSVDTEEDDYDLECSYANIERARRQLLNRLRRFEELAQLDPMDLEQKLQECPDYEYQRESVDLYISANEAYIYPSKLQPDPGMMYADTRKLVPHLIVKDKSNMIYSCNKKVLLGRICGMSHSWKGIESGVIDMVVELDFKREFEGWKEFPEEEMAAEVAGAILVVLVDELSDELFHMDVGND